MATKRQLERTLDYYRKNALSLAIELGAVMAQHEAYKAKLIRRLTRGGQCIVCGASESEIVHGPDCVFTELE